MRQGRRATRLMEARYRESDGHFRKLWDSQLIASVNWLVVLNHWRREMRLECWQTMLRCIPISNLC